ncbi:MAG: SurA N-terminal domain-containing protein, partial [Cellvibrionaceae bacterium]|nr:SurA N-terminal domain-containing protein [Cellvibrionaceae bacterium]
SIPFVLFGVESLFAPSNTGGQVAEVNGEKITELELNRAVQLRRQQIIGRLGDQVPEQLISAEALRQPVLDQLILQKAEVQEGKSSRLAVDKATLDKILTEQVAFQQDGQFSPQLYRSMLAQLNYTPSSYKQVLTDELIGDQLRAGIGLSSFSTEGEVVDTLLRAGQTRDFYYVTLGRDSFSEGAAPTAEQVQAHYDAKQAQYMGPEKVKVEYINLDAKALASADDVSEDEA